MILINESRYDGNLTYINGELAHGVYYDKRGGMFWYKNGKLHGNNDQPAIVLANGYKAWYHKGRLHRDDQPAVMYSNGEKDWFNNDEVYFPYKE